MSVELEQKNKKRKRTVPQLGRHGGAWQCGVRLVVTHVGARVMVPSTRAYRGRHLNEADTPLGQPYH